MVIFAVCIGLMLFARHGGLSTKAAVFGATAGMLYGVAATLMKPIMETWHTDGLGAVLGGWQFWVMVIGGGVGFYLQQVSLATGRLVTSVATVSVVNPVVSVLLGALVLQERLDKDPEWHAVVAVGALAVALLGATLIASASDPGPSSTPRRARLRTRHGLTRPRPPAPGLPSRRARARRPSSSADDLSATIAAARRHGLADLLTRTAARTPDRTA